MTYDHLVDFVERRMRMAHIYQPVMLLTLLQHDGQCSEMDIAKAISVHDPTQIEYYHTEHGWSRTDQAWGGKAGRQKL
jgi:ATP adenylyltransferase